MSFIKIHKNYLMVAGAIWAASFVGFLLAYLLVLAPQKNHIKHTENKLTEKKQAVETAVIKPRNNKIGVSSEIKP